MLDDLALMPSTESLKFGILPKFHLFVISSKTSTIFPIRELSMPIVPHYNLPLKLIVSQFLQSMEFYHSKASYCPHKHDIFVWKPLKFVIACVIEKKIPIVIFPQCSLASLYFHLVWMMYIQTFRIREYNVWKFCIARILI